MYNNVGQKTDKNSKLHQASHTDITSFVKESNAENKIKEEVEINNIERELYDMRLTGSLISAIYRMLDIPDDAWNIGL